MSRWLLGCPDIALVCLQFCSAPDTIAFYSMGRHHWSSYVASHAQSLIPVLWKCNQIATILEFYWRSLMGPDGDEEDGDEDGPSSLSCSAHRCLCAYLYRRYEYLVVHCQPGYMSRHLNFQLLELPLKSWSENQVTFTTSEN